MEAYAEVALLVLISEPSAVAKGESGSPYRFFDVRGVFGPDKNWRVDFQKHIVVDLSVLELAVFNPDGSVRLRRKHPNPEILLSPGWQRRLKRAKTRIFKEGAPPEKPLIGMGKRSDALQAAGDTDLVCYPLHRVGRLEPATARAILAAWATFNTRAALEHDFAHVEAEPPAIVAETGGPPTPAPIPAPTTPPPAGDANAEAPTTVPTTAASSPEAKPAATSPSAAAAASDQKKAEEPVPAPKPDVQAEKKEEPPKG